MVNLLLLGALIAQQTTAATATDSSASLLVVVAAPIYHPDGAMSAETSTLSTVAPSVVHVYGRRSVCDTAIAGATEPRDAGYGWRVTAQALSVSEAIVKVSIDWRRVWDNGRKISSGPSGTVQLSLHPGDRIPLDHIPNPGATDACRAVGLGLEIRLARAVPAPPVNSALLPLGAVPDGNARLDADLWLVQTLPSGAERAQHQTVRLDARGGTFAFAAMKVDGDRGDVSVEVLGSFRRYRAATGGEFLYVSLTRALTGEMLPPGGLRGGTSTVIGLPGPAEVLSLEIPGTSGGRARSGGGGSGGGRGGTRGTPTPGGLPNPPPGTGTGGAVGGSRGGGGGVSAGVDVARVQTALETLRGHAFSLRLRVTPVPGS